MFEVKQSGYQMTLLRCASGEKCVSCMNMEHTFSKISDQSYDPTQCNNPQDYQLNNTHCKSLKTFT
jgi:hypothetical protein